MTHPHDPLPPPPDDPQPDDVWITKLTDEVPPAPPVVPVPVVSVSVRPVTRRMGPRAVAAPMPVEEGSGWAAVLFLSGGLALMIGMISAGYWGISTLHKSQTASRERALLQKTEFGIPELPLSESLNLINNLKPLETDDERAQDLRTGFAPGELGTDPATAHELELMLQPVARATGSDPISSHLSRPHLLRRILPMVPKKLRADFGLAPERLMQIGYSKPEVTLVRVRPWDTGDASDEGRVVYANVRSRPESDLLPFRFWVVREAGIWKCVDYELTYYGLSAGEMATLKVCTRMCPGHVGGAILDRLSDWGNAEHNKEPEQDLAWLKQPIQQMPIALRDSTMILALQDLNNAGLSNELWAKELCELPVSTRSFYRGELRASRDLRAGRAEAGLRECDDFRTRFGDASLSVLEARAQALLSLGRFDDALRDLESLAARFPTESDLIPLLALACRVNDLKPLVSAVTRHPRPGEAVPRAYYALTASRGTDGVHQFIEALASESRCRADAAQLRSRQAESANKPDAALEAMRQALELADEARREEFRQARFQLMLTHGQAAEACALYADDEKLVAALMESLNDEESWPSDKDGVRPLLDPLKRLTQAHPQDHEAWYLLGTAHATLEEWDEAVAAYAHSMQVEPVDKPAATDQPAANPEQLKLAYYSWTSALQSAGRWPDLEQAIEKDAWVAERLAMSLSWSERPEMIEWLQRYVAAHPETPAALNLNVALAQRDRDWGSTRKFLATLIDQEKDENKLDQLRRQLAAACLNDPALEVSCKEIRTAKTLDFACQTLQHRGDTRTLLQFIALLKAARPPRGVRNRLPFWEAHAWAQIGRYQEFDTPAIQKLFLDPPAEDVEAIRTLSEQWNLLTPGPLTISTTNEGILIPDNLLSLRMLVAAAVRMQKSDLLLKNLSDREQREELQLFYAQPAYAALWTAEFRPVRELAPPQLRPTYNSFHRIVLLEPGEVPDPAPWEARLQGLSTELGRSIEIVPLTVSKASPARQVHWVQSGDRQCLVALGSEPADDFAIKEHDDYSRLTPEHRDLLRTHRWWVQVWPGSSHSPEGSRFSETVAAALINEQTLAVYHDGYTRALIGKGPLEFRTATQEVDRFARSTLPWTGLDLEKLKQTRDWTGAFWWSGPKRPAPEPEPVVPEPKSLYERFRSCPADQVLLATIRSDEEWVDDPLEVEVERFVIQAGQLESARCRVVTPSRLRRRLVPGEPLQVSLYQLTAPRTVPRKSGGSSGQGLR